MIEAVDSIIQALQAFYDWITVGIFDFVTSSLGYFFAKLMTWYIEAKIFTLTFMWSVAESILDNLDVSTHLNNAFSSLDSTTLGYITFFRFPEAINTILNAAVTRFLLNMVGW